MSASQDALIARFRGFLAKIEERLKELIAEADAGVQGLAEQSPDDTIALGNAMSGLDHRVRQLKARIDETWNGQISGLFMTEGGPFHDVGVDIKRDFELAFDEAWDGWKARATSGFYRHLWPIAEVAMRKPAACSGCGAPLTIADPRHSVSAPCAACRAVTQVIPDKSILMFFTGAPDAFAAEAALPLRYAIERFRVQVDRERRRQMWSNEGVESLDRWETMERAYWERYAEVKARVAGEPTNHELINSRLKSFRQFNLELNPNWRRAKGL